MKNLLLTICLVFLIQNSPFAQLLTGPNPTQKFNSDNLYNATTIRNPVLFGDHTGTLQFSGWLTPYGYVTGAEITTIVSAIPVGQDLSLDIIFRTDDQNRLRIGSNGSVSVNSDDQPARLSVTQYSDQSPATSTLFLARGGTSHNVKTFRLFTDASDVLTAVLQGNMEVENGNLVVKNGKVGIGIEPNDMPGNHKLYVNGSILCTELKVKLKSSWPDYVFSKEYNLMSLKNLETFIQKEAHLPGVPSAEDVRKNGHEVGEMQRIMLEKIEELTLYVIQQQKEIDVLRATLDTSK